MTSPPSIDRVRFEDGSLDDISFALHRAHPLASQYIAQAPALAAAACKTMASHITYGEVDRFGSRVAEGPRLKDLMVAYGLALPMRKLVASSIRTRHRHAFSALAQLDPSTLSQSIPDDSQGVWLDGINHWSLDRRGSRAGSLGWFAKALGADLSRYEQVGSLIDYLDRGGGALNERWTWQRAMAAVEEWHRTLRDEAALERAMREKQLAKTFDDVICKSLLPDEAAVEGMVFRPLRTLRRLREEGIEMRHCVAAYAPMVKHGQCAIVAVKRQGVGIATMELDRSGRIVQLKGHCNQAPTSETRRACDLYVLLHWRNPDEQATERAA